MVRERSQDGQDDVFNVSLVLAENLSIELGVQSIQEFGVNLMLFSVA
jgi:hypothetical protein